MKSYQQRLSKPRLAELDVGTELPRTVTTAQERQVSTVGRSASRGYRSVPEYILSPVDPLALPTGGDFSGSQRWCCTATTDPQAHCDMSGGREDLSLVRIRHRHSSWTSEW